MISGGKYYKFKVNRKTDLGYMLITDNQEEVLMFYKESDKEYYEGDILSAFIYYDKKGRLCATTKEVLATVNKIGLLEVVSVSEVGVYLNNLTSKDVLLSSDILPKDKSLWPEVKDRLFVLIKDKNKNLVAKIITKQDIKDTKISLNFLEETIAIVHHINKKGIACFTYDLKYIFIPYIFIRKKYRVGEIVNVRITKVLEDVAYGMLTGQKEVQMREDESLILDYLKAHNNKMPFTAKSSSASIEQNFNMSRNAFKRALGALYKREVVYFDDKYTYLKEDKETN